MRKTFVAVVGSGSALFTWKLYNRPPRYPSTAIHQSFFQDQQRTAVVVGAGVLGICTAYNLQRKGFKVCVIDSSRRPASECSDAPAGGLTMDAPQVNSSMWITATKAFLGLTDTPFFFLRTSSALDPHFWRWMAMFARTAHKPDTSGDQLRFTQWAVKDLIQTIKDSPAKFENVGLNTAGSLTTFFADDTVPTPREQYQEELLSPEDAKAKEPALREGLYGTLKAALFNPLNAMGHCGNFTRTLAEEMEKEKTVSFWYNTRVVGFETDEKTISSIHTNRGVIPLNDNTQVIFAAGARTPLLGWLLGLWIPVYPLKGYNLVTKISPSATKQPEKLPSHILVDSNLYVCNVGSELRAAAIGEFSGWNTTPDDRIATSMLTRTLDRFPHLRDDILEAPVVTGLRPFTGDGKTILGKVETHDNLWVNVPPGFNGWKTAMGSGKCLAALIDEAVEGEPQKKEGFPFDTKSLSPSGRIVKSPAMAQLCLWRWASLQ